MLQRTLFRTLAHHAAQPTILAPCATCTCACGNGFRTQHSAQQRRTVVRARRAPSTFRKQAREEPYPLTPSEAKRYRASKDEERNVHFHILTDLVRKYPNLVVTPQTGTAFIANFAELAKSAQGRNMVDLEKFKQLVLESRIPLREVNTLCYGLMAMHNDDRILGKKLLFTLSAVGFEEATIRICNHALLGSKTHPHILRASEIAYERGRLREIARGGKNFRAMVLEGKIARVLGNEDYAVKMWEQAMSAAVAQSEREAAMRTQRPAAELTAQIRTEQRDMSELSSPWIDLTLLRYDRYLRFYDRNEISLALAEYEKARKAMETGCRMDDPTSHYHAAEFFKEVNEDRSTGHTSSWLYHMTKAAATGHAMAAHALAVFYAETGWKYIEDEPPDHIKPTPFDSYPVPDSDNNGLASNTAGFIPTLRRALGYDNNTSPTDTTSTASSSTRESDAMFHAAIFPSTPEDRWTMAFRWLEPALKRQYAPSYLYAAKMLLQKTLWAQAQAPTSALEMTPERYTYASKADYEAGRPIVTTTATSEIDEIPDPPNPGYDEPLAKFFLAQTLHATQAHSVRQTLLVRAARAQRKRHLTNVIDFYDQLDYDGSPYARGVSEDVKKWLRDPDVREMWEEQVGELEAEVVGICEEKGWELRGGDGGLLYRCGGCGRGVEAVEGLERLGVWKNGVEEGGGR